MFMEVMHTVRLNYVKLQLLNVFVVFFVTHKLKLVKDSLFLPVKLKLNGDIAKKFQYEGHTIILIVP